MGAFKPHADETHDLGSTTARWKDVHADRLVISGENNLSTELTSEIGGPLSMSSNKIIDLADPIDPTDAATKGYVDGVTQGLSANDSVRVKDSVRVATTEAIELTPSITNSDSSTIYISSGDDPDLYDSFIGLTIDGVVLSQNDRILIKNGADPNNEGSVSNKWNGIYIHDGSDDNGMTLKLTRAVDFDAASEIEKGAHFFVEEGTVNADSGYVLTTDGPITIGTTELQFVQFSGAGQITSGTGLTKSGNTLSVSGISISEFADATIQTKTEVSAGGGVAGFIDNDTSLLTAAAIKQYIESQNFGSGSGDITGVNIIAGTGLSGSVNTASGAHTQTLSVNGHLEDIAGLSPNDNDFIVYDASADNGNGEYITANAESARDALGLGSISTQDSDSVSITGGIITGLSNLEVAGENTSKLKLYHSSIYKDNGPEIEFRRYNSEGLESLDNLGEIWFKGSENNSNFYSSAAIICEADGSWAPGTSHPGSLVFYTTQTDSIQEVLRLDSYQNATFANDVSIGGTLNAGEAILESDDSEIGTLTLAPGSITASSGNITFDNEHLSTEGSITAESGFIGPRIHASLPHPVYSSGLVASSDGSIVFLVDQNADPSKPSTGLTFYKNSFSSSNKFTEIDADGELTLYGNSIVNCDKIKIKEPVNILLDSLAQNGLHLVSASNDYDIWSIYRSGSLLGFARTTDGTNFSQIGYINPSSPPNQIDFTGQHRSIAAEPASISTDDIGKIVVSSGSYNNLSAENQSKPSIDESLPTIMLSSTRKDKKVYGVISSLEDPSETTRQYNIGIFGSILEKNGQDDNRVIVNSVGEGAIWVCNINGNLENGDYITTCEVSGLGMKQDDDLLHNYTVAKITQDCVFDLDATNYDVVEFVHEGQTYRKAFVGCTYHCG
jgi:hypothetical protein